MDIRIMSCGCPMKTNFLIKYKRSKLRNMKFIQARLIKLEFIGRQFTKGNHFGGLSLLCSVVVGKWQDKLPRFC